MQTDRTQAVRQRDTDVHTDKYRKRCTDRRDTDSKTHRQQK